MNDETLPDDHKRSMGLIITVAEFRELMRAAMYRADDLAASDGPTADVLRSAAWKLGEAWNGTEVPDPAPGEYPGSFPDIAPTPDIMAVRMANAAAQALTCFRCGRKYRPDEREQLVPADEGKFKCDPSGPLYDACQAAEEHGSCVRCGRDVPYTMLRELPKGGGLVCSPVVSRNYDQCQRIYNTV